jgi:signal transduction histidine kinase
VRPDGTTSWVLSRAVPVYGVDGYIEEWFGAAADITDRKLGTAELRRYQGDLEEKVQERTFELASMTGALQDEIVERGRQQRKHRELVRNLALAQEEERRRISRELHDEVGQQVSALLLGLGELATEYCVPEGSETLRQLRAIAQSVAKEVHHLAVELRPTSLDDLGLVRAMGAYVDTWAGRAKLKAEFHAVGFTNQRLDPAIEITLYRIVQEALQNVLKHARATAVSVIIQLDAAAVSAIIEDDGAGFETDKRQTADRLGLLGMKERAALVGGELRVESTPGSGTSVFLRVPRPPV